MAVTQLINSALSATTYLSTTLNSLAIDGVDPGAAINNSVARDQFLKVEISLATVDLSAQVSPGVEIRLIESIDGTTYEDDDDTAYAITIPVASTNAAHKRIGDIVIPPGQFKLSIVNKTGVAFAATGNTVKYAPYTIETDV